MKKKAVKCESIALPMTDDKKEMISHWKNVNKALSPLKCTKKKEGFILETISLKGSDQDRNDLICAGVCLATGAKSSTFGAMLLNSCINAGGLKLDKMEKKEAEKYLNAILDTLHSLKPNDEIEGMLVTRLISINLQISKFMTLSVIDNQSLEGVDLFINRSTKLIRLYNETLEALMRYRRKGVQNVFVQHQHVNVNNGGQAMVGNFQTGGEDKHKNSGSTP